MIRPVALFFFAALAISSLQAQWLNKTYALRQGWNGVWLSGDASHATVEELLADFPNVTEVWRWNPNPDQVTFTTSPSEPTAQSDEWTIWKRNDPAEKRLSYLVGNSAYLFYCASDTSVSIKQLAIPPEATWQISGANFLGFPALANAPTFSSYFASFPSANTSVLSPSSQIFKYNGGPLGASNPLQISPSSERLDPDKAYWIQNSAVTDFTAPLEYELPSQAGLSFGRTLNSMTMGVTNRSTSSLTLTVSLQDSATAPTGQPSIDGGVLLRRRVFDSATNSYAETAIPSGGFTVSIPASGRTNLEFGIDRSLLVDSEAFHASILRIRDSASLTDVRLPVSAQASTPAGLWIARATVTDVVSTAPSSPGSTTSRPFVLVFLIHVDETGAARLLSQAFTGRLTSTGNPRGISISEETVLSFAESDIPPQRYVAAQMPLVPYILGQGAVSTGATVTWQIPIPHDDPTNPFVHTYHPDHDNLDASFSIPLAAGVESYDVGRACSFTFTSEPPNGGTVSGWGASILGGTYQETLTGLNSQPLQVSGTFGMQRISEIAEIDLTPPSN